jgi:hypothetical protein
MLHLKRLPLHMGLQAPQQVLELVQVQVQVVLEG